MWGVMAMKLPAQSYAPPHAAPPDESTRRQIEAQTQELARAIDLLRRSSGPTVRHVPDIAICLKAAVWIVRHNEFYARDSAKWTLAVLEMGLAQAKQIAAGSSPTQLTSGVYGYVSRVDSSVQPYAVTLPESPSGPITRLDVVLHGRDVSLTEVKFIYQHRAPKLTLNDQQYVHLEVYGRGNNAYRWAGETDVFEAVEDFLSRARSFPAQFAFGPRQVLRGFSMGGAGSWHLGLHHPDRWSVVGPGAGFTTTHGYIKGLPERLAPQQEACLRIYDAVAYAENASNVSVVAYGGDQDPQLQAAQNIEAKLKPLAIPMTLLVAPGLAHAFPLEWQRKAEVEYNKHVGVNERSLDPRHVRFVTYTTRYDDCAWVRVQRLIRHYERTLVDAQRTAQGFRARTENVQGLQLLLPYGWSRAQVHIEIDQQALDLMPIHEGNHLAVRLERDGATWRRAQPAIGRSPGQLSKVHGLQGPIDDAFMAPFLCVRGTGAPWHEAVRNYIDKDLQRFRQEWDRFMRGELPIKNDTDISADDVATKHLVLFGDPSSNSILAKVLPKLPVKWTRESIEINGHRCSAAEHVPVLIAPNPLYPTRYVVVNSGHTFHAPEFLGTNAQLYPRLGDYGLLKLTPTEKEPLAVDVVTAGLFTEEWQEPGP